MAQYTRGKANEVLTNDLILICVFIILTGCATPRRPSDSLRTEKGLGQAHEITNSFDLPETDGRQGLHTRSVTIRDPRRVFRPGEGEGVL